MLTNKELAELKLFAKQIRYDALLAINAAGFGHVGGSLSMADLISLLYGRIMKYDPQNPKMEERDWLITSKGHAGPAVYAALAEKGFFPKQWLLTMNQPGTRLPSHTDRILTPGIDMTTGSLGQGLSLAVGAALAFKIDKKPNRVFCIVGDGESQEGQIWEAVMYAAQQNLGNLTLFIDDNGMQIDGVTSKINNMQDYVERFKGFNWDAVEVDGHDFDMLNDAIERSSLISDKPTAVIMKTIKGKGWDHAVKLGIACHSMHMHPGDLDGVLNEMELEIQADRKKLLGE